VGGQRSLGDT